ncbi:hypothetical protein Strain138_001509 [Pseudogemmatithrix spongiicola]|uniref:PE-PGRS family protein n=1 Tax=Pseudogemmatithrix spongiicola TaxID=3062599 RepID=A0AA49JZZ0_9BACT|nr:hypothetical protein Strain138_001509 [Gemmatimonadaceae bacterium 'strain 138']WKW15136.1 hypothetical protein Strain318_001509 [Gemmatimonadaceae bacterium 'strain 318']
MRRWPAVAIAAFVAGCEPVRTTGGANIFLDGSDVGELRGANLREASGLVASVTYPGHYWLHNDSGNDAELFLIDSTGAAQLRVRVEGVANRDWEDIARRGDTLLIAETGDNDARWDTVFVHAVMEPKSRADSTASVLATFPFRYPDGPRDAETLLVDPLTGDWFIVSKREERSRLYRYPAPQRPGVLVTLERVPGELPFRLAVGGDVSADGREVLVKTYDAVYYWERRAGESLAETLGRTPMPQPYTAERQGEAIAFTLGGTAYMTTSEVELDVPQLLLRYQRRLP